RRRDKFMSIEMTDFSAILGFLTALRKNNNREWFEKNKPKYLALKASYEDFLESLHKRIISFDEALTAMNPRKAGFRIYRDVRFSKDKSPYKPYMGAGFSPKGKLVQEPGYYIHIEPRKSFIAGGLYQPDAANLSKWRQEIDYNGEKLKAILKERAFAKEFGKPDDFDKGKLPPKGYAKEHPDIELLKHKSFIFSRPFSDAEVKSKDFEKKAAALCKKIKPLVDFIRVALA
ncbi:MAG: TIGR02453 family protein, partial [Candidatus Nephrothrix sp. EaCA]